MYYQRRKNKKTRFIILTVTIVVLVAICTYFASTLIFGENSFLEERQDKIAKENKEISEKIKKERINKNKQLQENEEKLQKQKEIEENPKITTHIESAKDYAYKCSDVKQWILNPQSYTKDEKLVFLTFDDGPSSVYTEKVLDTLKEHNVHGTFFIVGTSADKDFAKPILKREINEGHSVGMHSYSHNYSFLYPNRVANLENIKEEINKNLEAIQKSLGKNFKTTVMRFPGGHLSWKGFQPVDEYLKTQNICDIDWNVLSGDAEAKGSQRYNMSALENVKSDINLYKPKVAVILMHDIHEKSPNELGEIINYLKSEGYKFGILD